MSRLAIYLDVEGTSKIYPEDAPKFHSGFDQLLCVLFAIGTKVYPEPPQRLFAHQVGGDGLVIVSDFEEESSERFISIAVVLMQVLLVNGLVGKAGISAGSFGDIQGCIPSLRDHPRTDGGAYSLGAGLLTTLNVMGTALINSHRYAEISPRGSRLAVDPVLLAKNSPGVVLSRLGGPVIVDWIHTRTATMELITQKAEIELPSSVELEKMLVAYVMATGPLAESDWGRSSLAMNNCKLPHSSHVSVRTND